MKLHYRSQMRSSRLGRVVRGSVLGLGFWCFGVSSIGMIDVVAQTIPRPVRSGYSLLNQGLVNQAIVRFEQIVQRFPRSLEAHLGLAIAYRRAGRIADAFQAYERAAAIDSTNRLALLSLGTMAGFRVEWHGRGIAALTTLLQQQPSDVEARTQRALLYLYEGKLNEAIADYELVLQQAPSAAAVVGAAQAYAYSGKYAQSLPLFERYLGGGGTLQPDAAMAYSRALRETGNPAKAVQALEPQLRRQQRINSTALRMRAEQAVNYAAIGRVDVARRTLTPLRGRSDVRMVLGRSLFAIGRMSGDRALIEEGMDLFKLVLTQPNISTGIKREIADVLSGFPQTKAIALQLYRDLALSQPDNRGLQTQIAVLAHETEQLSEAQLLSQLSQLLSTLPSDPVQQQLVARSLAQLRTPNPALLPLYENLLRMGTAEPLLYFRVAQMYLQQRDYDRARSVVAAYQATPIGSTDPAVDLLMAVIDRQQGNIESSIRRYQTIINSNPADSSLLTGALQGLAGIYQGQKRYTEALTLYNRVISLNPTDSAKPLGLMALKYQAGIIRRSEAEALLNQWLAANSLTEAPPELYSLVGALPATRNREPIYRTLVQAEPDNIGVQLRFIELMVQQEQPEVMNYVNQLVTRNPKNVEVYFLKGHVAQLLGNFREAVAAYEAIVALEPANVDALSALGGVLFRQRRYQPAIEAYRRVLTLQPDNAIARQALIDLGLARRRRIPLPRPAEDGQQAAQPALLPILTRSPNQANQANQQPAGFVRQGTTPLPWE